jgi:hypothetical protein
MIEIELTQGKIAYVDNIDKDLEEYKWCTIKQGNRCWYAIRGIKVESYWTTERMHRAILERIIGKQLLETIAIDHINHDGLDNRRKNLRIATKSENNMNTPKRIAKTTSKYKGVTWNKQHNKWQAQIRVNNKHIHIGYYKNEEDAAREYDKKAKQLFKQFRCTNLGD